MASPQLKNGYVKIANEILDALAKINVVLNSTEWVVILCVIRKTYGWSKKNDKISISQFQKMTGRSRRMLFYAIKSLEQKRILIVNRSHFHPNDIVFNKDYEQWGSAIVCTTPEQDVAPVHPDSPVQSIAPEQCIAPVPNLAPTKDNTYIHTHTVSKQPVIKENHTAEISDIIGFFNSTCGTKCRVENKEYGKMIRKVLSDGFTVEDCKSVIKKKWDQWRLDPNMVKYIRINTLFRPSHFETYLNEKETIDDGIPDSLRPFLKKPVAGFNKR